MWSSSRTRECACSNASKRHSVKALVRLVHTRQRDPRGLFVIEQRVVEIEQHGPRGASWLHILIIETAGLGCMVN